MKARENAELAKKRPEYKKWVEETGTRMNWGVGEPPKRTASLTEFVFPKPTREPSLPRSQGNLSKRKYELARTRLELEHMKRLLDLEEEEFHESSLRDDDEGEFDPFRVTKLERPDYQNRTEDWVKTQNVKTLSKKAEVIVDEFSCNLSDWIDDIGTPQQEDQQQREAFSHGNIAIPLMLSGMQDFMIDQFSGNPADWPEWSLDFKNKVHDCTVLTTSQKLSILKKSLSEEPRSLIFSLLFDARHYRSALGELRRRYGSKDVVARAQIEKIRELKQLRDSSDIVLFRSEVGKVVHNFSIMGMEADLKGQTLLAELVVKLSRGMKESWGNYVRKHGTSSVLGMYKWLGQKEEALRLGGGLTSGETSKGSGKRPESDSKHNRRSMNNVGKPKPDFEKKESENSGASTDQSGKPKSENLGKKTFDPKCSLCSKSHWLSECPDFLKKTAENRLDWFRKERRCYRCTKKYHRTAGCTSRVQCKTCKGRHQTVLHEALTPSSDQTDVPTAERESDTVTASNADVYLMILPVRVYASSGLYFDTNCMVDSGSQTSFLSSKIADVLELKGPKMNLKLSNVAQDIEPRMSQKLRVSVCDPSDSSKPHIPVEEVWSFDSNLNLPSQSIPRGGDGHPLWEHISDLDIPDISSKDIGMLIGANCKEAMRELVIRKGPGNLPDAVNLPLGWCLRGTADTDENSNTSPMVNHLVIQDEPALNSMVEQFWTTESFGCKFQDSADLSMEDRYALEVLSNFKRLPSGQYEVGMLWKSDFVSLSDNYSQAVAKYHAIRNRLSKQPEMFEKYRLAMNRNLEKGYARLLTPEEAAHRSDKTFTIPHHGVWNPDKQKMRPVFDAACKFRGTSLNDNLLSGPDLANSADGVKMRFRVGKIPMSSDVEDMFCRVRVPQPDSDALRFVWDPEFGPKPSTHVMLVHIFGSKSSPTCANFALRQTALDNERLYPTNAVQAILNSTYVDDFLHAADSLEEAVQITRDVISILGSGGFNLTKWVSPCQAVLDAALSNHGVSASVNLDLDGTPVSRVLGLRWIVKDDLLGFVSRTPDKPRTKRGLLAELSTLYDPLGFISPFTIRARTLFQELWITGIDWDDAIGPETTEKWLAWRAELPDLENFSLPRRYWPLDFVPCRIELHVFCDASEKAFCCVCYIRVVDENATVHVALVLSRTRVSPTCKKQLTLPRLELQSAVLGIRLSETIQKELSLPWDLVRFWSDSVTVLQYINNDSKRFKTFVSNRVAEIRASSEPSQWSHVPGITNPADDGTRGLSIRELLSPDHRWLNGPSFLWGPQGSWPQMPGPLAVPSEDPEVKKSVSAMKKEEIAPTVVNPNDFSSFHHLLCITAWCKRFVYHTRHPDDRHFVPLTGAELRSAKIYWLRSAQLDVYSAEIEILSSGKDNTLHSTSNLIPLLPKFEKGFLRVGGRIDKALIPYDARHQIILPPDHRVTILLLLDIHERMQHAGPATVAAHFRQTYWVVKGPSQVKKALKLCIHCRNLKAQPVPPRMAPLPAARVTSHNPPFHYCGVDYFGPLYIRERRSTVRRWVALFTCLTTRAVHLELVNSLSSDAYILAFRRFVARRSEPAVMFSDNGSNFCGAVAELRDSVRRLNADEKFRNFLSKHEITFHFNPPSAPHMGGIWERLVGSVKRSLKAVFKDRIVHEDVLLTALVEIENTVNSRPLTPISSDPSDPEPLTPRHLLAPASSPQVTPQDFTMPEDENCRRRWRQAQFITDQFWKRWRLEYLPNLTVTAKWHSEKKPLKAGDIVLVVDHAVPRGLWPLGRILQTFPGPDGRVRVVSVKTKSGVFKRPVHKLCYLESSC